MRPGLRAKTVSALADLPIEVHARSAQNDGDYFRVFPAWRPRWRAVYWRRDRGHEPQVLKQASPNLYATMVDYSGFDPISGKLTSDGSSRYGAGFSAKGVLQKLKGIFA